MKTVTFKGLKSSRTARSKTKKRMQAKKRESNASKAVHPKIRKQMIEEAAYFRALNRDFEGDCCDEDWLEAEIEIDTSLNDVIPDDHGVEDWQERYEEFDDS